MSATFLEIQNWGLVAYDEALDRQQKLQSLRINELISDTLILVEHPPVVTLGLRGGDSDLRLTEEQIGQNGVALHHVNRGGFATAHEPGQLVAYPIVRLKKKDLRWYSNSFLQSLVLTLNDYDLSAEFKEGEPGLWVNGSKIASFGIAVKKWVSSHGIALNINNDMTTFHMIIPCGKPTESVTSMQMELGSRVEMADVLNRFIGYFCQQFDYTLPDLDINRDKLA